MISRLDNISKCYRRGSRSFEVFHDLNIFVNKQELLVLSGQSGSGKSTLLALMGGYLKPDQGNIFFDGKNLFSMQDTELSQLHSEKIGYLPQSNVMISEFTILENVMLKSLILGENDTKEAAMELLDRFEIGALADKYPFELSGGELRRAAIARLLISKPQLYLLDEPTNGLDKSMTAVVMKYLENSIQEGSTVVIATHDDLVMEYGSRIFEVEKEHLQK